MTRKGVGRLRKNPRPVRTGAKRFLDTLTSEERKQYPMSGGCVDYFPDALAIISHVSWKGNEKHNPGQSLHWSRWNSVDHADCVIRHHSTRDNEEHGIPLMHMAEETWRTLAMLQEAMEKHYGLDLPRGARNKPAFESVEADMMRIAEVQEIPLGQNIREPRDAGIESGYECVVQFTNMGEINDIPFRTVVSDGPFLNHAAAEHYARTNPNKRRGIASIHTLNPQEESPC